MSQIENFDKWFHKMHYPEYLKYWNEFNKQKNQEIDEKEILESMYLGYGSDTGVLFGIPSNCKDAVKTVIRLTVKAVLELQEA